MPAVDAHGAGAVADAGQQCLRLRAEIGDRPVDDGAALFLLADGGALFLGAALLGHVFMGGDPAAVRQRLVTGVVRCGRRWPPHGRRVRTPARAPSRIFWQKASTSPAEQPGILAMLDQSMQAQARPHDLGRQLVHLHITDVAHDDAALRVEHAQALRHVVERVGYAPVAPAQPLVRESGAGDERDAECAEQGSRGGHGQKRGQHAGSSVNSCRNIEWRPLRYR